MSTHIYQRRNGDWGASCDGCQDTGHFIKTYPDPNPNRLHRYSVRSIHEPFSWIARFAHRETAERRIQADWRKQS